MFKLANYSVLCVCARGGPVSSNSFGLTRAPDLFQMLDIPLVGSGKRFGLNLGPNLVSLLYPQVRQ